MIDKEYFDDEEFREILDEYEQKVNSGQSVYMDVDDLADIADYYQQEGRYEESQQVLETAAKLEPDSVVALNYKIHDALTHGNYAKAEELLDKFVDRELPEYVYCRAELWLAQGMVDEADKYLRDCLKDVPPDEYQDYVLDVANLYADYEYNEKALEWMMRAKPENSDDFKELMGRTLFGLGKYDDSERIFNELIDKNPFQKRYWHALANTQYMKEDYGASVTSSEYAIAIDPEDAEGLIAKANALYRLEDFEEAEKYFGRYNEKEPDDEFGLLYQGTCLMNSGRCKEATEILQKAEEVAPEDSPYLVDIYQELGFAYSELKMPETALYYLNKTDALECDHVDILVVKGHILLANGRLDEADKMFKQAVKDSCSAPEVLMRIIVSLYDNRFVEASYNMFHKFFEMVEDDWNEGYSYMSLCCYDLKYYDEFLANLKKACEVNPQEARLVLSHLFPDGMKPEEYYDYMKQKI